MKRLVWIQVIFELKNNKHDVEYFYPDKPYFALKVSSKLVKYLITGRLLYMHFSYHYKRKGNIFEESTYTIKEIVNDWTKNND